MFTSTRHDVTRPSKLIVVLSTTVLYLLTNHRFVSAANLASLGIRQGSFNRASRAIMSEATERHGNEEERLHYVFPPTTGGLDDDDIELARLLSETEEDQKVDSSDGSVISGMNKNTENGQGDSQIQNEDFESQTDLDLLTRQSVDKRFGGRQQQVKGFRGDLGKRRPSSFRGDLGKRARFSSFRGDLGKRLRINSFRGDLGKRARFASFRGDLGKRNDEESIDRTDSYN